MCAHTKTVKPMFKTIDNLENENQKTSTCQHMFVTHSMFLFVFVIVVCSLILLHEIQSNKQTGKNVDKKKIEI